MKSSGGDALRWLRQAENDLSAARLLQRQDFYAQACFMAHQVEEKALKALAYYRGDRFVTGHSLMELEANLLPTYPQLSEYRRLMGILDQHYVPTRYPNALPGSVPFEVYTRGQAKEAVNGAGQVVEAAKCCIS